MDQPEAPTTMHYAELITQLGVAGLSVAALDWIGPLYKNDTVWANWAVCGLMCVLFGAAIRAVRAL